MNQWTLLNSPAWFIVPHTAKPWTMGLLDFVKCDCVTSSAEDQRKMKQWVRCTVLYKQSHVWSKYTVWTCTVISVQMWHSTDGTLASMNHASTAFACIFVYHCCRPHLAAQLCRCRVYSSPQHSRRRVYFAPRLLFHYIVFFTCDVRPCTNINKRAFELCLIPSVQTRHSVLAQTFLQNKGQLHHTDNQSYLASFGLSCSNRVVAMVKFWVRFLLRLRSDQNAAR